jgi:hypothetical protein
MSMRSVLFHDPVYMYNMYPLYSYMLYGDNVSVLHSDDCCIPFWMILYIQSRLKVSIRVAKKYAFLLCIGGWC